MSDIVKNFRDALTSYKTKAELSDAIKVIDEQIAMNMSNVNADARQLDALTPEYRELHESRIEQARRDVSELEDVKRLLKLKMQQVKS